ncbi:MAG: hypothetical protein EOP04_22450, partial [Proteobacteria bacterium]
MREATALPLDEDLLPDLAPGAALDAVRAFDDDDLDDADFLEAVAVPRPVEAAVRDPEPLVLPDPAAVLRLLPVPAVEERPPEDFPAEDEVLLLLADALLLRLFV